MHSGSLNVITLVKLMISVAKNLNILPISNIHCLSSKCYVVLQHIPFTNLINSNTNHQQ